MVEIRKTVTQKSTRPPLLSVVQKNSHIKTISVMSVHDVLYLFLDYSLIMTQLVHGIGVRRWPIIKINSI